MSINPYYISRILLADDDLDDYSLFAEAVNEISNSITVSHVRDGEKLINYLKENDKPDIIFLDLNMPGKNGKDCLLEIRKDQQLADIPVIIYSTSNGRRDVEACFNGGATYYLVKPNTYTDIVNRLKFLLNINIIEQGQASAVEKFVI